MFYGTSCKSALIATSWRVTSCHIQREKCINYSKSWVINIAGIYKTSQPASNANLLIIKSAPLPPPSNIPHPFQLWNSHKLNGTITGHLTFSYKYWYCITSGLLVAVAPLLLIEKNGDSSAATFSLVFLALPLLLSSDFIYTTLSVNNCIRT